MKTLAITTIFICALSASAQAGSWSYSCQSSDGEVNFTREELVYIPKNADGSFDQIISKKFNDDFNGEFKAGGSFRFKDEYTENKPQDVLVTFTEFLSESTVEENTECPPGDSGSHGPGYSTTTYKIKGTVKQFETKKEKIYTCHEIFGWSGRCHFDGGENL